MGRACGARVIALNNRSGSARRSGRLMPVLGPRRSRANHWGRHRYVCRRGHINRIINHNGSGSRAIVGELSLQGSILLLQVGDLLTEFLHLLLSLMSCAQS